MWQVRCPSRNNQGAVMKSLRRNSVGYRASLLSILGLLLVAAFGVEGHELQGLREAGPHHQHSPSDRAVGRMEFSRAGHAVVPTGDGFSIIGGVDQRGELVSTIEEWEPGHDSTQRLGTLRVGRSEHAATRLESGEILVTGGRALTGISRSVELVDPRSGESRPVAEMFVARHGHSSTLLPSGQVLVVGGDDVGTMEVYDPDRNEWMLLPDCGIPRSMHAVTPLRNGDVLVVGGIDPSGKALSSAEILDESLMLKKHLEMGAARVAPLLVELPNGNVQIFGGTKRPSMELFDLQTETFSALAHLTNSEAAREVLDRTAGLVAPLPDVRGMTAELRSIDPALPDREREFTPSVGTVTRGPKYTVAVGGIQGHAMSTIVASTSSEATIETDKVDYAPGETVVVSGAGWEPGEEIYLTFSEEPSTHEDLEVVVTADANGAFTYDEFTPDLHDVGVTFLLVGSGQTSGRSAMTSFRDAESTTLTIFATPNPSIEGALIYVAVEVRASGSGQLVTDGVVHFYVDSILNGSVSAGYDGVYRLTLSALSSGSHTITAGFQPNSHPYQYICGSYVCGSYSHRHCSIFCSYHTHYFYCYTYCTGYTTYYSPSSASLQQFVIAETSTVLSAVPASSLWGQSVTLTATVSSTTTVSSGTVIFRDGTQTLASVPVAGGAASFSTSTLYVGSHSLMAEYSGVTDFAASSGFLSFEVMKASQTIDFAPLPDRTSGDPDFSIGATGGASGNPVTFSASGSCTVSGSLVHLTGAGSCSITASQDGDANHEAASPVTQTFTIMKASPVIIWPAPDPITEDTPLGTLQLNASAWFQGVPLSGSFSYDPPAGTFLDSASTPYLLATRFLPADTANFHSADATVSLEVINVAPVISSVIGPDDPFAIPASVSLTGTFSDGGIHDTHTAVWDWDDGSTSTGDIDSFGIVSGTHVYAVPGVYAVRLTVTDDDGASAMHTFQFVVVFDPDGGFVTGGGWIESPAGAYIADTSLAGKASFGFVSKYKRGASAPIGQTDFNFHVASMTFHSSSYDWLVIAGAKAQYKGQGTINGSSDFGFLLTATDGQVHGGEGVDRFRIKIWDNETDAIVYDNIPGSDDIDASGTQGLGGGNIVIHSGKN